MEIIEVYRGIPITLADNVITLREGNKTEIKHALDAAIKRASDVPDLIVLTTEQAIELEAALAEGEQSDIDETVQVND